MKLGKSLLLGSAAALVATAGASAADLPSRKAAPVAYVKVCDAYGAGFFYIPGTDTCVKIGGRVRADYLFSAGQTSFTRGEFNGTTGVRTDFVSVDSNAQNLYGWEARARVDLDARTPTAWGTVQTVLSLRLARSSGTNSAEGPGLSSSSASPTLEAAYIRFAGFTFGAARDNFAFMPSTFYGAGHWGSFANGAKQLAYTAVFGGGLSATVAIQDATDTTAGGVNASGLAFAPFGPGTPQYSYNNLPQLNGRVDFTQGWGQVSVMGAVGKAVGVNPTATYDTDKTVWAVGAGVKINLPMLAAGDVLWLNAAYAEGMTEYTTNWTSFKSSDTRRNVGGYVINHPSWINTIDPVTGAARIETLKSWNLAAIFSHYWTPSIRHSFLATYGQIDGTRASRSIAYGNSGAFGDATVWNLGTQLAWLPVRGFEIGVEVLYARVEQDIRRTVVAPGPFAGAGTVVTREKEGNFTGRMRVERTF